MYSVATAKAKKLPGQALVTQVPIMPATMATKLSWTVCFLFSAAYNVYLRGLVT